MPERVFGPMLRKRMNHLSRPPVVHSPDALTPEPSDDGSRERESSFSPDDDGRSSESEGSADDDRDDGGAAYKSAPEVAGGASDEEEEEVRSAVEDGGGLGSGAAQILRRRRSGLASSTEDVKDAAGASRLPRRPSLDVPLVGTPAMSDTDAPSEAGLPPRVGKSSSAWYDFDKAIVIALLSPVGNWLTGGDYVRNVLLLLLLVFYLHQIIEVPWSLYHSSRPRQKPPHVAGVARTPAELRQAAAAASELRALELVFLLGTVLSPLAGTLLLRRLAAATLGPGIITWFSSALFVLATGIRPWSHLVARLGQRTEALHDLVHYPAAAADADRAPASPSALATELAVLQTKLGALEEQLEKVRGETRDRAEREEMYAHVDDALDAVESTLRAQARKAAAARDAHDTRLAALEAALRALEAAPPPQQQQQVVRALPALAAYLPAFLRPAPPDPAPSPPRAISGLPSSARAAHRPLSPVSSRLKLATIPEDTCLDPAAPAFVPEPNGHARFVERKTHHPRRHRQAMPGMEALLRLVHLAMLPVRMLVVLLRLVAPKHRYTDRF